MAHFGASTFLVMTLSRTALTRALSRIDVHVKSHNSVTFLLAISFCTVLLKVIMLILVLLNAVLLHVVLLNVSLLSLALLNVVVLSVLQHSVVLGPIIYNFFMVLIYEFSY